MQRPVTPFINACKATPTRKEVADAEARLDARFSKCRPSAWKVSATYRSIEDAQEAWDLLMNVGGGPISARQPHQEK
jgi:hypothetical protein